jgi:DNA-binding transcriptional MerR regulator
MVRFYSKFLDVSREGLKFYERKGLLSPERDCTNGYRVYKWNEIHLLLQCKKYRKFGFCLKSIAAMIQQAGDGEILRQLCSRRDTLKKEIEEKKKVLASLDGKISQLNAASGQGFGIVKRPALYWTPFRVNNNPVDESHLTKMQRWMRLMPHTDGIVVWSLSKILDGQGDVYEGHMIEEKNAVNLPPYTHHPLKNAEYLPETFCVYTVKDMLQGSSDSDPLFPISLFSGMLAYMRDNNLKPSGDGTARIVRGFIDTQGNYHSVLELWLPFSES